MKENKSLFEVLKNNTMFHLSLGSKELFHSNFLEFLWNEDKVRFVSMLEELLGAPNNKLDSIKKILLEEAKLKKSDEESKYILAREKENFDICIYHKEEKVMKNGKKSTNRIYDVIIENKVKSIPYKEQLNRYEEKVQDNQGKSKDPIYILLSLATDFPEKNEILKQKNWYVVSYQELHNAIQKVYGEENIYLRDYLSFIANLHSLKDEMLKANFKDLPYYNPEEMKPFAGIRLHDMYVKLRGSYFVCLLKKALLAKKHTAVYIEFFPGKREAPKTQKEKFETNDTIIWLSSEMTNAKQSTITVGIRLKGSDNSYDIQIEGDNYRHMFKHPDLVEQRDNDHNSPNGIESCLDKMPYFDIKALPKQLSENKSEWDGKTSLGYNQFKPDILHKYVIIPQKIKVKEMIKIIVEDVDIILDYIYACEKQAKSLIF